MNMLRCHKEKPFLVAVCFWILFFSPTAYWILIDCLLCTRQYFCHCFLKADSRVIPESSWSSFLFLLIKTQVYFYADKSICTYLNIHICFSNLFDELIIKYQMKIFLWVNSLCTLEILLTRVHNIHSSTDRHRQAERAIRIPSVFGRRFLTTLLLSLSRLPQCEETEEPMEIW